MKALIYFQRAMRLRCPVCGQSPIFVPWHSLRRLRDWFVPLDGCPRCGYPYEREPGYWLLSIWAINYGFGSLMGIAIYGVLETFFVLPLPELLFWVIAPVVVFNFFFARHSKALFLAIDHYIDPHGKRGGGDGGAQVPGSMPPKATPPANKPDLVTK